VARWLLLARDRSNSETFILTHESLAQIFGVSRSGVSAAAGVLRQQNLLDYARGRLTIRNPQGLADAACECYETLNQTLSRFLPPAVRSGADRVSRSQSQALTDNTPDPQYDGVTTRATSR
jgi:DNA-binding GntR family transcriptional regulator